MPFRMHADIAMPNKMTQSMGCQMKELMFLGNVFDFPLRCNEHTLHCYSIDNEMKMSLIWSS
jgi:hypothetical protein